MSGCGGDENEVGPTPPTNLVLNVTVTNSELGKVSVTATADNTNYFDIYFGDVASETATRSNDGKANHTYTASGTFTIRVQAHATAASFIEKTQDVTINLPPVDGYITPESYAGMNLVWQDEFDGTELKSTDWTFETGGGGWGNQELQNYTTSNATVKDGYLTIIAKKEGPDYTSSRIKTQNKKSFKYGRIDIRARLPKGQGLWPALWMLGNSFPDVGWPKCGEIDIMEMIGGSGREKTTHGTPHWYESAATPHASYEGHYDLSSGTFADKFHVFTITWDANKITWYMDDIKFHEIDITPANLSEFRESYFFIFNIAVGGQWPGNPDGSTVFPQQMVVDYVRVFQPE
jgi:beta-glucanase (GH16 family)